MKRARAVPRDSQGSVNLLSPWVLESLQVRRLRRRFAYAALALVVAAGLSTAFLRLELHQHRQELRGEESVARALSQQIAALAPVQTYLAEVGSQALAIQETMQGEVAFSRVLAGLERATPQGATITSISTELPVVDPLATAPAEAQTDAASEAAPEPFEGDPDAEDGGAALLAAVGTPSSTCPGPDPFGTRLIAGCVTLTGTAESRQAVSVLVTRLAASDLFVEPFVSTTTSSAEGGGEQVDFSGTVGLDATVFSGRYAALDAILTSGGER